MEQLDCLFIGSSTKDILMLVDSPPMSDQRISASQFTTTSGGVSSTAAVAYRRLGGRCGIISAVGDDDTSVFIQEDLGSQDFAYLRLHCIEGHSSSTSMIQVEQNGKRCLTCFGGCIDKLTFDMIDKEVLHNTRILHLGVLEPGLMLQLVRYCKAHTSAIVSIDGGNLSRDLTEQLLPYADIFIPDNKTAMKTHSLLPEEACRYYVERGAKLACVTAAEKGTFAYDGNKFYHGDVPDVQVVDTTGAGDNFHGAFLYCVNKGWGIQDSIEFSNIFASLTCEGMGGRASIPTIERVMALMRP